MRHYLVNSALFLHVVALLMNNSNGMTLPSSKNLEPLISSGLLVRPRPNLYLLGTVHIGSKSADDAQMLIEAVQPANVVVEVPPSRLKRIQQKLANMGDEKKREGFNSAIFARSEKAGEKTSKQTGFIDAVIMFPTMASAGYSNGGISGLIFSTVIVWSSLLKRSVTNSEEMEKLPRKNEFEAAIHAAERIGANVIAADIEFEDLVSSVAKSLKPLAWANLLITVLSESIGLQPSDPVRRRKGESMVDWEIRRRDISTARSSRHHAENANPELSKVLVDNRDKQISRICLEALEKVDDDRATVCIVGLVHLDGIMDICEEGGIKSKAKSHFLFK